jgi:hypothetical protein
MRPAARSGVTVRSHRVRWPAASGATHSRPLLFHRSDCLVMPLAEAHLIVDQDDINARLP